MNVIFAIVYAYYISCPAVCLHIYIYIYTHTHRHTHSAPECLCDNAFSYVGLFYDYTRSFLPLYWVSFTTILGLLENACDNAHTLSLSLSLTHTKTHAFTLIYMFMGEWVSKKIHPLMCVCVRVNIQKFIYKFTCIEIHQMNNRNSSSHGCVSH